VAIIGEAFIAIRPLMTGFGTAVKTGVDAELAGADVFAPIRTQSKETADDVEKNLRGAGEDAEKDLSKTSSHIGSTFKSLGESLANWGIPFSNSIGKIGSKIDEAESKSKKMGQTLSTVGGLALGVGAVGFAAVAAESVHLASGLQAADSQIASHENISVKAADRIGKAFQDTAGTSIFSANTMAESFGPVSGVLAQVEGHALTVSQSLGFVKQAGELAEATNSNLGSTTSTLASIMQGFQVPLKGVTGLTNDLFNTSRITGVGIDSLGSVIDRLKARLGVAAPTVGDLSTLLVDLNEHGVQGSRGLLVVNSAITKLLSSVPAVDAATAKAANTLATKLTSATATANTAAESLASAQEAAATRVSNAQLKLQQEQERIASSTTAGSPTVAQQIALQNAQRAVSTAQEAAATSVQKAQERLATTQAKVNTLQASAGTSTNLQVQAMQQLGLQVYNTAGKFVGMSSVIAQLSPRLHQMTQEQQLATLTQIFGASASKALLDTVLAGPAAYDKASRAVRDSSTAHAGAEKQAETLKRQAQLLGATLVDEGDKLGTWLIPKLEDLAKWTEKDVEWMTKHKVIAEAFAVAIGSVLALAVGAFVVNTGAKFLKFLDTAAGNIGKLGSAVSGNTGKLKAAEDQQAADAQAASDKIAAAQQEIADAAQTAAGNVTESMDNLATSLDTLSQTIAGTLDKTGASFAVLDTSSSSAEAAVDEAMTGMTAVVDEQSGLIIVTNERTAASFALIPEAAEAAAAKTALAQGALGASAVVPAGARAAELAAAKTSTAGLSDLRAAPEAALEPAELTTAGTTIGETSTGLMTAAAPAIGGLIAVQLYNSFAEKDVGKVIGTKAASVIGDVGTGAAIGAGIGSVVPVIGTGIGTVAGGIIGGIISQRADFAIIKNDNAFKARDARENARNEKIIAAAKLANRTTGGSMTGELARDSTLQKQSGVLANLQAAVVAAKDADGTNSANYKTALQNLYTTEAQWLPGLAKSVDLTKVNDVITAANAKLGRDQATYSRLGGAAAVGPLTTQLAGLKAQLASEKAAGASEGTLLTTQASITATNAHLRDLKDTAARIAKDQTAVTNAGILRSEMEKVNGSIATLKTAIATTAPPTTFVPVPTGIVEAKALIATTNEKLSSLEAKQAGLAKDGTLAATHAKLEALGNKLGSEIASGASESSLQATRSAILATQTHFDALTAVAKQIHDLQGRRAAARAIVTAPAPGTTAGLPRVLVTLDDKTIARDSTLKTQTSTLAALQAAVVSAKAQDGVHSAAYKAAIAKLDSTETKWLPGLSKDTSLVSVNRAISATNSALSGLEAKQSGLAKDGTLTASTAKLDALKTQLATQSAHGASEGTLADTRRQIVATQTHIDQLKSVALHITKDQTALQNAQKLKESIDKVDQGIALLRQQIATTPPPHLKISTKGTLTVKRG
jgi:hypothetical protein